MIGSEISPVDFAGQLLQLNGDQLVAILAEQDSKHRPAENGFTVLPNRSENIRTFMIENEIMDSSAPLY